MKGKILFVVGLGVGYVLGTRAGRERYEQIRSAAEKVWTSPPCSRASEPSRNSPPHASATSATRARRREVVHRQRDQDLRRTKADVNQAARSAKQNISKAADAAKSAVDDAATKLDDAVDDAADVASKSAASTSAKSSKSGASRGTSASPLLTPGGEHACTDE